LLSLLQRVNLDIDRQRPTADRDRRDECDVIPRWRPVHEDHRSGTAPQKVTSDSQQEDPPVANHLRIAEQPVHPLDAVLRQRFAGQTAADRRWAQPPTADDPFHHGRHRRHPHCMHYPAATSNQLTYHLRDAHPCDSLSFDNPRRSRIRVRVAY
jgi:hypothetical protein